jgi:hypothetical protein
MIADPDSASMLSKVIEPELGNCVHHERLMLKHDPRDGRNAGLRIGLNDVRDNAETSASH